MTLIINIQNLPQENGTLLMTKIMYNMAEEMKIIQPLSLKQKSLNQIFVIIKPNLFDYSDPYILVTRDIKFEDVTTDTNVSFKNCAPFTRRVTHINDEHVETAGSLDIIMLIYNLL